MSAAVARYARHGESFALPLLDLDHFKSINDAYGHGIGDEVLRRVSDIIAANSRPYDVAARCGGEEFAIILNQTEWGEAEQIGERILASIRTARVPAGDQTLSVTCSAGLTGRSGEPAELNTDTMLKEADAALYEAKRQGRDRLVVRLAELTAATAAHRPR